MIPTTPNGTKILASEKIVARYFVKGICVPVTFETLINMVIAEHKGMPLPETFERVNGFNAFGFIRELNAVWPMCEEGSGLESEVIP